MQEKQENEKRGGKCIPKSFKLRHTSAALEHALNTYEELLNGEMVACSEEYKKALQTSIIELCKAILAEFGIM